MTKSNPRKLSDKGQIVHTSMLKDSIDVFKKNLDTYKNDLTDFDKHFLYNSVLMYMDFNSAHIQSLVDAKIKINLTEGFGSLILDNLNFADNNKFAKLLFDNVADVNITDSDGNTPLHLATNNKVANLLIAHGADINARNKKGEKPKHLSSFEFIFEKALKDPMYYVAAVVGVGTVLNQNVLSSAFTFASQAARSSLPVMIAISAAKAVYDFLKPRVMNLIDPKASDVTNALNKFNILNDPVDQLYELGSIVAQGCGASYVGALGAAAASAVVVPPVIGAIAGAATCAIAINYTAQALKPVIGKYTSMIVNKATEQLGYSSSPATK